jgi:hypothetical protein
MNKKSMTAIVALAVTVAISVFAAEKSAADQMLIRLKVDGKAIAELHAFDGGGFSLTGDQVTYNVESTTTTAKGATLQFGGSSGKSITVKADELEVLPLNK